MMLNLRLMQSRLRQATRLKLFEHERAGVYDCEVRKASFNASQNGAPTKSVDFVGKRRNSGMSEPRRLRKGEGYGACDAAAQMKNPKAGLSDFWRSGWDSNPRESHPSNGFQDFSVIRKLK